MGEDSAGPPLGGFDPSGHTVASLLRTYRVQAGLSQSQLAERANMSVGAIGSLEQGVRTAPYRATLESLGDALELAPDQRRLLGEVAKRGRARRPSAAPSRTYQSNVPKPLTSFVPRQETAELERLLAEHRLVTVTGSAGVGKTRTALEVAAAHRSSDVLFVDLSPISDSDLVAAEIASAFNLPTGDATTALPGLVARLHERRALIVLDNCEHVLEGASTAVIELLRTCAEVRFLATSREPLRLSNEIVYRLPSLRVPPVDIDCTGDATFPALELFVTRARLADARADLSREDLIAAADICRKLDGIPLAIELAAGRAPLIGFATLRDHIELLALETGARDVPARHQTMKAAIAWSFALLSLPEQMLLRRMSVLAGAFTLSCAQAVCASAELPPEAIASLVLQLARKSLIETKESKPEFRYALLDSVREYAASELKSAGEGEATEDRLALWLLDFVRSRGDHGLPSVFPMLSDLGSVRRAIEAKLRREREADVAVAGELVGSYRHLWLSTNRQQELRQLCQAVTAKLDEASNVAVAALVATAMAGTAESFHRLDLLERAIVLCTKAGDIASAAAHTSKLARHLVGIGRFDDALRTATRAEGLLRRVPAGHRAQRFVRENVAAVFLATGDPFRARKTIEEYHRTEEERHGEAAATYAIWRNETISKVAFAEGHFAAAAALCEETFARYRDVLPIDPWWRSLGSTWIGSDLRLGNLDRAALNCRLYLEELLPHADRGSRLEDYASIIEYVAFLALTRGDIQTAGQLLSRVDAFRAEIGFGRSPSEENIADELRDSIEQSMDSVELRALQTEATGMSPTDCYELMSQVLREYGR